MEQIKIDNLNKKHFKIKKCACNANDWVFSELNNIYECNFCDKEMTIEYVDLYVAFEITKEDLDRWKESSAIYNEESINTKGKIAELELEFKAEQQAHNDLREKLKEIGNYDELRILILELGLSDHY
jgi:hypothetical protein